jgi:hypothetical protein
MDRRHKDRQTHALTFTWCTIFLSQGLSLKKCVFYLNQVIYSRNANILLKRSDLTRTSRIDKLSGDKKNILKFSKSISGRISMKNTKYVVQNIV